MDDLLTTLDQIGGCRTLIAIVHTAGLTPVIREIGPLTLLAPTDDAFSQMPAGSVDHLFQRLLDRRLRELLWMHLLPGALTLDDLLELSVVPTLYGTPIPIVNNGQLRLGPAAVRHADIPATNGLVHLIDNVLMPPSLRDELKGSRPPGYRANFDTERWQS